MNSTPWDQYGLIVHIATALKDKTLVGKTKLQKLIFLMNELRRLPIDYRFQFYTYGPYASSLSGDVSYLSAIGALHISYDASINTYDVRPGDEAPHFLEKAAEYLQSHGADINAVLEGFGHKKAKELELVATLVYVMHYDPDFRPENEQHLIEQMRALKPKFSEDEVRAAMLELQELRYA